MADPDLRHRMRRHDRAASVVILLLLCGIGFAVYALGRNAPPEAVIPAGGAAVSPSVPQTIAPAGLLGRYRLAATQPYDAENLYEYINGQAPRYIQFGFKSLVVAEYEPMETAGALMEIVADLYDMGTRRNAFGIFHDSRPVEDEEIPLGNDGHGVGDFAAFWKSKYYVRVKAISESGEEDMEELVRSAAEEVAADIVDPIGTLPEFTLFPKDGLVAGGLSYERESALGLSHLNDVFIGDYERDGEFYRLFFMRPETEQAAEKVVKGQEAYLRTNGTLEGVTETPERSEVWGNEKYVGPMLMIREGRNVVGSIGISDLEQARAAVKELLDQVAKAADELEG